MNFKTTIALLVLVVIVIGGAIWMQHHKDNNPTPDKAEDKKLVDFDTSDVTRVAITNYEGKKTVLEKTGNEWKLLEPVNARAKSFEVDDLVRALVDLKSRGQLEESKKNAGGLDKPSFVVELTAKGKVTKLSFGDKSDVGDSLYVLVNDSSKPDIVGNGIYGALDKPANNYRDMKLITTGSNDIKQVAITDKGKTIKLQKKGSDWEITEPANIPAEQSAVMDLVSNIVNLDATEFVESPSASAKARLVHPRLTVAFSTKAAAATTQPATTQNAQAMPGAQTLEFGGYQDVLKKNVFASLNGKEVVTVTAASEKNFEKTPLDLRNREVLNISPDHVSSFTIAINKPATTQPTTMPAEMREFTIERHKVEAPVFGPALPNGLQPPATQPAAPAATQPTTQPTGPIQSGSASDGPTGPTTPHASTTQPSIPSTQPAVATTEPSTEPAAHAPAIPAQPTTKPSEIAMAKWLFTSGGSGAADEGQVTEFLNALHPLRADKYLEPEKTTGPTYLLTIHTIPANAGESAQDYVITLVETNGRVDGYYKDLHFEVERMLLDKVTGDFKTKKPEPAAPPAFHGGSPFGG